MRCRLTTLIATLSPIRMRLRHQSVLGIRGNAYGGVLSKGHLYRVAQRPRVHQQRDPAMSGPDQA